MLYADGTGLRVCAKRLGGRGAFVWPQSTEAGALPILAAAVRQCPIGGAGRPIIGCDSREKLACEPARFYAKLIKREKRGSHCVPEQGVATGPVPARIVPKSKLANKFVIELLVRKYQQPIGRFIASKPIWPTTITSN